MRCSLPRLPSPWFRRQSLIGALSSSLGATMHIPPSSMLIYSLPECLLLLLHLCCCLFLFRLLPRFRLTVAAPFLLVFSCCHSSLSRHLTFIFPRRHKYENVASAQEIINKRGMQSCALINRARYGELRSNPSNRSLPSSVPSDH
ncbi:unnamed protein product [Periconia digitata]|uniref:Uncharacterized protein n=1 Tax=Periconia digitata TaxID=1303443 RepID=A0A9W4XQL1_9PLEO|nr:unnamed protein product [Periconia digitata]